MLFFAEPECVFVSEPSIFNFGLFSPVSASNHDRKSSYSNFLISDNCSRKNRIETNTDFEQSRQYQSQIIRFLVILTLFII